jgi:hypothetical protein
MASGAIRLSSSVAIGRRFFKSSQNEYSLVSSKGIILPLSLAYSRESMFDIRESLRALSLYNVCLILCTYDKPTV